MTTYRVPGNDREVWSAERIEAEVRRCMGDRVRVYSGDPSTGRDWCEEWQVVGRVSQTMGPHKSLILCPRADSPGGMLIGCNSVVRLEVKRSRGHWHEVYRHPTYHQGAWSIRPIADDEVCGRDNLREKGYTTAVDRDGTNHANFKSEARARRWLAFITGERHGP